MISIKINGVPLTVEKGTSLLDAATFLGFPIPTLCHDDGLAPYGGCRLCVVEIGDGARSKLVTACTYKAEEGLNIRTNSERVQRARKLLLEMYVATCPSSKRIQDLCSQYGVRQVRYERKDYHCIQCGLCVRTCEQQMMAGAIGFSGRGSHRMVHRPFDMTSDRCRQCGACLYVCPVCESRCAGPQAESTLCNGCLNFSPVCFQSYSDAMCYLDPCHACELAGPLRHDVQIKRNAQAILTLTGETK